MRNGKEIWNGSKADQIRRLREVRYARRFETAREASEREALIARLLESDEIGSTGPNTTFAVAGITNDVRVITEVAPVTILDDHSEPALALPASASGEVVGGSEHQTIHTMRYPKKGRCLDIERHLSERSQEPWRAAGISRRTWYRRKRER